MFKYLITALYYFISQFLDAFAKLRKATLDFVMSFCLSDRPFAWNNSAPI